MDVDSAHKATEASAGRHHRRRFAIGANVSVGCILAVALTLMANYLSSQYFWRWDLSQDRYYELSQRTIGLMGSVHSEVNIDVVFSRHHDSYIDIQNLLTEYAYAARHVASTLSLNIRTIDPDRDLGRMKELKDRFNLDHANVIVVSSGGRYRILENDDLFVILPLIRQKLGFNGEMAISSALNSVTQQSTPVVYVLKGHGERDMWSYHERHGYSSIARLVAEDNIELKPLVLALTQGIPADCDALIVAGPSRRLGKEEIEIIHDYLEKSGRLLAVLDPYVRTGLEPLMAEWGVKLVDDLVVDSASFSSGREFFVGTFGEHAITAQLGNTLIRFSRPRSVAPISEAGETASRQSDRPRVTALAYTRYDSWAKGDASDRRLDFDAATDRRGPISLAVAVERGTGGGESFEIPPTRIVVVGDSDLASNAMLNKGADGNVDVFMSTLNWLVDREALMGIAPRPLRGRRSALAPSRIHWLTMALAGGIPAAVGLIGIAIWTGRRK